MKRNLSIIAAVAMSVLSAELWASEQGKEGEILCAITNTVSCDAIGDCLEGPANAVNLPVFMNFHPDKKVVESAKGGGERRTSTIASVSNKGDSTIFVGEEEESAWSATINKSSGSLTGAITTDGVGFLIFGSCIAH